MSTKLPNGLTVQQVIEGLGLIADLGLDALGQEEFVPLANAVTKMAGDAATMIQQGADTAKVLRTEVDAEQAAGDALEAAALKGK